MVENKIAGREKKGLTPEEFKILWNKRKESNKDTWKYNIIQLRGKKNLLIADEYKFTEENEISLYYRGYRIADLNLNIIKFIY